MTFKSAIFILKSALRLSRHVLLAGIISAASANGKFLVRAGVGIYVDGAEASDSFGCGRLVGNRVLVADVVSDGRADLIHVAQSRREERDSAGAVGNRFKRALGVASLVVT